MRRYDRRAIADRAPPRSFRRSCGHSRRRDAPRAPIRRRSAPAPTIFSQPKRVDRVLIVPRTTASAFSVRTAGTVQPLPVRAPTPSLAAATHLRPRPVAVPARYAARAVKGDATTRRRPAAEVRAAGADRYSRPTSAR